MQGTMKNALGSLVCVITICSMLYFPNTYFQMKYIKRLSKLTPSK